MEENDISKMLEELGRVKNIKLMRDKVNGKSKG
jgi:RNA recognition motif-containing protein